MLSGLVAVIMVTCVIPFAAYEDTDALTGHGSHMSLGTDRASIFVSGGQTTEQFTVTVDSYPAGKSVSDLKWRLNDLDENVLTLGHVASFDASNTSFTASGVQSVTVYAQRPGSIEVEVYIENYNSQQLGYYDSAVIYVRNSPTTHATEFNFFFRIYNDPSVTGYDLEDYWGNGPSIPQGYDYDPTDTSLISTDNFAIGFWKNVTFAEMYADNPDLTLSDFNAFSALVYLMNNEEGNWGLYTPWGNGWIESFLGLGTYDPMDGTYIYWAQYHAVGNTWVFNDSVLDFIDTEDCCDIGLIFCASLSEFYAPPFPPTEL